MLCCDGVGDGTHGCKSENRVIQNPLQSPGF